MPLREELECTGNWLFRWRSYLPLALVVLLVAALQTRHADHLGGWPLLLGVLCIALGLAVRILVAGFAPDNTSGRNTADGQVAAVLNTSGMYSVVRHPLYVGNFLMWLGIVVATGSLWSVLVFVLAFWLYYERIMFAEEEFLRRKFGAAFERWAERTPAFIPRPSQWRTPPLPFCVRTVLRREYSGAFAAVVVLLLLDVLARLMARGRLRLAPDDVAILVPSLGLYLALRLLKKRTRVLHVPGR